MYATATEAAEELGVSRQCVVINYIRPGQLQAEMVGGRWLIPRTALEDFKKLDRPAGLKREYRNGRNGRKRRK